MKANHLCALHELNFCYKMQHNLLPFYFVNSFFTRHNDTHRYNTRNARNFQLPQVKHEFAKYCIRYRLPMLYNNTPSIIIDKINTHSQQSFKRYVKMYYLNNYDSVCNIRNRFVCSNYQNKDSNKFYMLYIFPFKFCSMNFDSISASSPVHPSHQTEL